MSYIKSKQILVSNNFDINNNRLINVSNPIDDNDAINKSYFDSNNISASGGTISGDLAVHGNATIDDILYIGGTSAYIYEDGSDMVFVDASGGSITLSNLTNLSLIGEITASGSTTGNVTTSLDITAISNKQEIISGITSTDELLISDGLSLRRMDISVLDNYIQNNISTTISGSTDTNINTPLGSDLLAYNYVTSKWENTKHLTGDYTIIGDLYISGTTTIIDVDNYSIKDNVILLNSGETQSGVSLNYAGIEIDRGLLTNYQIVYDETNTNLVGGEIGSLYNIPIQNDIGLPLQNNVNDIFKIYIDDVTYSDTYLSFNSSDNSTNIYGDVVQLNATTSIQLNSIASYSSTPTITNDLDLVYKKYVDDNSITIDITGRQDSDIVSYNSTTDTHDYTSVVVYDDILRSIEANLDSDIELSTFIKNGYKIHTIIASEESGNNAGDIRISTTSGNTGDVALDITVNAGDVIDIPIGVNFFSLVNDQSLFISSSLWGSGKVTLYFTLIKII